MTITKYTFFSPTGTEYPVTANADAKLYMMLSGVDYKTFKVTSFGGTINSGLTRTYNNVSFLVAGRYFELVNHLITLRASSKNYIHVNIDLGTPLDPVTITNETADLSNTIDINNNNGIYKRCFEVITTSSTSVTAVDGMEQVRYFDTVNSPKGNITTINSTNINVSNKVKTKDIDVSGTLKTYNLNATNNIQTKTLTATGAASVGTTLSAKYGSFQSSVTASHFKSSNLVEGVEIRGQKENIKPLPSSVPGDSKTPTYYSNIWGADESLRNITLFRSGNTVWGSFPDVPIGNPIPGGGAIVGWIRHGEFTPVWNVYITAWTTDGQRCRFTINKEGALQSHTAISSGKTIWGSMMWITEGSEGGPGYYNYQG